MSADRDVTTWVFVYGTLLTGEPNHRLLARTTYGGEARTEPAFELVSLGPSPAMVPGGATAVVGEVYEVDHRTLRALDRLEGHPNFYRRSTVRLEGGDEVQTYVMDPKQARGRPRITGGDWRRARRERQA